MPEATHAVGESFPVQFAWRLPNGDYLRAVFEAEILDMVPAADKYLVRLRKLIAGRQEDGEGQIRDTEAYSRPYWSLVGNLIGNRITVAFEAGDGRPLHMRLETLTGEHDFFYRFEKFSSDSGKQDFTERE